MLPNKIAVTINPADITNIIASIKAAEALLPFLIALTPDERASSPGINNSNKTFVEDVVKQSPGFAALLPAHIKIADIKLDLDGFNHLDVAIPVLENFLTKLKDTRQLMGFEAFMGSLSVYRYLETLVRDGVPGAKAAFDALKARFAGQGNFKKTKTT